MPFVLLLALAAAFVWGDRRLAAFFTALLVLVFLGGAWVTYSYASLPVTADESLNPIVRYTGAIVLLAAVVDAAAARIGLARRRGRTSRDPLDSAPVAAAIVAVPLLAYPVVVAADGVRFPSAADCVRMRLPGETAALDLVFGSRDTAAEAERLLERVGASGTSTPR